MNFSTVSVILILLPAALFFGCESENPVCTDNFCFLGEVFPREDLDTSRPYKLADVDDTAIFASLRERADIDVPLILDEIRDADLIQPEPPEPEEIKLKDIVEKVKRRQSHHIVGKTIRFQTRADAVFDESAVFRTSDKDEDVLIYAITPDFPQRLSVLNRGRFYNFIATIHKITPPSTSPDLNQHIYGHWAIWVILETTPEFVEGSIEEVSVRNLVRDVIFRRNKYVGNTIEITATVIEDSTELRSSQYIVLETDNRRIVWYLYNDSKRGELFRYESGESYTFTMFIHSVYLDNETGEYTIFSFLQDADD